MSGKSKLHRSLKAALRALRRRLRRGLRVAAALATPLLMAVVMATGSAVFAAATPASAYGPSGGGDASGPEQRSGSAKGLSHTAPSAIRSDGRRGDGELPKIKGALAEDRVPDPEREPRRADGLAVGEDPEKATPPPSAGGGARGAVRETEGPAGGKPRRADSLGVEGPAGPVGPEPPGRELAAERTANAQFFRNDDGTITARVYSRPVHYKKADGTWAPIDATLERNGNGRWVERADSQRVSFAKRADDALLASFGADIRHEVGFALAGAEPVEGVAKGGSITYPGARKSSDVVFAVTPGELKEYLVLHDTSAPTSWLFPLRLKGLTASLAEDGSVEFADASGTVRQRIPRGFMVDSNIDERSGEGQISTGVTYHLTTVDGAPALRVDLDSAWLSDESRVFPVVVDPTTTNVNTNGDTYVESPYNINFSGEPVLKIGTYDGGGHKANSYLKFGTIGSSVLENYYVQSAALYLDNVWSYTCSPNPVYVKPITSSWSASTIKYYPGLSYGSTIGSASFASGSSCAGGSKWQGISLGNDRSDAGVKLIDGWTHGGSNLGLAVTASMATNNGWKQFASANSSYPPYLSITYSNYGAKYSGANTYIQPTASTAGSQQITATNWGSITWSTSAITLSTQVYTTSWVKVTGGTHKVAVPSTVSPKQSVTMTGKIPPLDPGQYYVCWDMYNGTSSFYLAAGVTPLCYLMESGNTRPQIDGLAPLSNVTVGTLRPRLTVWGSDPDDYPGTGLRYQFEVWDEAGTSLANSGWISDAGWSPPAGTLEWNQTYRWFAIVSDGSAHSGWSNASYLSTKVAQPLITSHLGGAAGSERGFDPQVGSYTTSASDAAVEAVGPALAVDRVYNSLDPGTGKAFGAGWSSAYDMAATPDSDGSGAVVVGYPDGREVRFGQNGDGQSYTPPAGQYATLRKLASGYELTDKSGTVFTFGKQVGSAWKLTRVADSDGRAQTWTYNADNTLATVTNPGSRSLHFTWSGGHVRTVSTDAPAAGEQPLTWTYSYSGDLLTTVCPPTSATACTTYSYSSGTTSGSHYRSAVLDANPKSYWRLGESSGTSAASEVLLNQGNDAAAYQNVTLGAAGALPGTADTAGGFNGTSSYVRLPNRTLTPTDQYAVSMWFKTSSSAGGVLFSYQSKPIGQTLTSWFTPALYVGQDGKLRGLFWDVSGASQSPITTTSAVNNGAWHHVVLTVAGDTQELYLDGQLAGTRSVGPPKNIEKMPYNSVGAGWASGWPSAPANAHGYFNGAIDEVAVYGHALGRPAVEAQHEAGASAANQLTAVTLPSGKTAAQVTYDTAKDRISRLVDENGGTWQPGAPQVTGSGNHYRGKVMADIPNNYYRLGESGGTQALNEIWNTDPPGTYSNVTVGVSGPFVGAPETAASFNGSNSAVAMAEGTIYSDGPQRTSLELWFKTGTSGKVLLSYQDAPLGSTPTVATPAMYVGTDGTLRAQLWDGHISPMQSPSTVTDNKWHHAVLVAGFTTEGVTAQGLFLDGVQVDYRESDTLTAAGQRFTYLGAGHSPAGWPSAPTGDSYFAGSAAEFALYGYTLSAAQVKAHYDARGDSAGAVPMTTVTVTDPGNKTLTYRYDPQHNGRLVSTTNALGKTWSLTYDTGGFVYSVVDPDANTVITTHDARGNTLSRSTGGKTRWPDGSWYWDFATSYQSFPAPGTYDAADPRNDLPTATRDPRSAGSTDDTYATTYSYTATGKPLTVTNPLNKTTSYTYTGGTEPAVGGGTQPKGLLKSTQDPTGAVTSYGYTAAGDLAKTTAPSGLVTTHGYDNLGRVTTTTQISDSFPDGVSVSTTYDGLDREVARTGPAVTDAVTGTTHTPRITYSYDVDGNITSQTGSDLTGGDPSRTVAYTYDSHNRLASATEPLNRVTSFGYDDYGNTTSMTDPAGATYAYAYSPTGKLLTTTLRDYTGDPNNPSPAADLVLESRAYDPAGLLASVTDSMGVTTRYYYTFDYQISDVEVANFRNPDGSTSVKPLASFDYDEAGNVIRSWNTGAFLRTDYTYDAAGRVTGIVSDPTGLNRATTLTYDDADRVTSTTVTRGTATERTDYGYDTSGNLIRTTVHNGATNLVRTAEYDQRGLVIATVDPRGNVTGGSPSAYTTDYRHDEAGQLVQITEPEVAAETQGGASLPVRPITLFGYDAFGQLTSVDDPNGNITTYTYDLAGRQVAESANAYTPPGSTEPLIPAETRTFDPLGRLATVTDPRGGVTSFSYDQLGNLAKVTQPAIGGTAGEWLHSYTAEGHLLSTTDPTGARSEATYDDLGRVVTATDIVRQPVAKAHTTRFGYDAANNLTSVTTPLGKTSTATYDAAGNMLTATDALGRTTRFGYDLADRLTKTTLADGTATVDTYDPAGRLTATADLDASGATLATTTYGYDAAGNTTSVTDPNGDTTTFAYDATDALTRQVEPVTATSSITTTFGYDAGRNRTRFTDGRGNATTYTYNTLGLPESTIEPATTQHPHAADRTYTTAYDAGGNPVKSVQPGGVSIETVYDELGRKVGQTGAGAEAATPTRSFGYDLAGRLTSVSHPSGTDTYAYNDRGQLLSAAGPSGTASYSYDDNGRLTSRTDASGTAGFTYDDAGQLATASDPLTGATASYTYNDVGAVTGISYGAGNASRAFEYDARHRLVSDTLADSAGGTIASTAYGYDDAGQITSKTTTGTAGAAAHTYTYDKAGRLASWNNGFSTTNYTYDDAGNRTGAGAAVAVYNARNQLVNSTGGTGAITTYDYNPRGALVTRTRDGVAETMAYDAYDQLVTDDTRTYSHDGLGRLATAGARTFTYNGLANTIVSDGAETYGHGPGGGVTSVKTGADAALTYTDQHGDLTATFTPGGAALAGSVAYNPYGEKTDASGAQRGIGYQGGWTDPDTGRVATASRWYDPADAAFTSRDTVRLDPQPSARGNRYGYADANPLSNADPTGHWGSCVITDCDNITRTAKKAAKWSFKNAWKYGKKAWKYGRWTPFGIAARVFSWVMAPTPLYAPRCELEHNCTQTKKKDKNKGKGKGKGPGKSKDRTPRGTPSAGPTRGSGYYSGGGTSYGHKRHITLRPKPKPKPQPTARTGLKQYPGKRPVGNPAGRTVKLYPDTTITALPNPAAAGTGPYNNASGDSDASDPAGGLPDPSSADQDPRKWRLPDGATCTPGAGHDISECQPEPPLKAADVPMNLGSGVPPEAIDFIAYYTYQFLSGGGKIELLKNGTDQWLEFQAQGRRIADIPADSSLPAQKRNRIEEGRELLWLAFLKGDTIVAHKDGQLHAAIGVYFNDDYIKIGMLGSAHLEGGRGAAVAAQYLLAVNAAETGKRVESTYLPDAMGFHNAVGRRLGGGMTSTWTSEEASQISTEVSERLRRYGIDPG